jgi:hypothetical protein
MTGDIRLSKRPATSSEQESSVGFGQRTTVVTGIAQVTFHYKTPDSRSPVDEYARHGRELVGCRFLREASPLYENGT